jgi:hypothetical protein
MKQLIGIMMIMLGLAACQDNAGERTHNTTDITTQRPASSDPNDFGNHTLDTSRGHTGDSSTVISYDTSAKAKHN